MNKRKQIKKELREKGKGFFAEFRAFINKGNVLNLAVAFIMGAAFTAIVTSLAGDLIMPFISIIFGKINIEDLAWVVSPDLTIHYGKFILAVVNFLLVAVILFVLMKIATAITDSYRRRKKKKAPPAPAEPPAPPAETAESILKDIRELLKSKNITEKGTEADKDTEDSSFRSE